MGFTRRLFAGIAAGVLAIATGASVPAASAAQAHAAAPARQVQAASQVREGTIRPAQGGVDTPPEGAIVVAEQTQQALRDAHIAKQPPMVSLQEARANKLDLFSNKE